MNTKIERLSLADVLRGKLNPRTHFDPEKIRELVASFREHGFTASLSHLLVRPHPTLERKYELICGERRWRAATELRMESVPAVVSQMEDAQVLELQLVENLQREGLTPLEEAEGFRAVLALCDDDGAPSHSVRSLADKIGRTEMHVRDRLGLCKLSGTLAGEALEAGELPVTHARLLARVPAGKLRDDFTRRVLKPLDGMAPIPYRQLERILRDECMIELRGSNFDALDPALVPVRLDPATGDRVAGGSCSDCAFNTKNGDSSSKFHMCMNPECFREKKDASHVKWMGSVTDEGKGRTALGLEEASHVFDISGKKLSYNSGFVALDDLPHEHDLKRGVKDPSPWKKLIRGQGVPVVLAKDEDGKIRELADHKLAVAAARQNEKDKPESERIFQAEKSGDQAPPEGGSREERQENDLAARAESKRKDQLARERAARIAEAQTRAILDASRGGKLPEGFWPLAVDVLLAVTEEHGDSLEVAHRHGLDGSAALNKFASKLFLPDQMALTVELLLTMYVGETRVAALPRWAKVFGADLKLAKKTVETAMATEEKAAAEKSEIAEGVVWNTQKEKIDDFEWNGHGQCVNPDAATLTLPKAAKIFAAVEVANEEKGWKFGIHYTTPTGGGGYSCRQESVSYSSRTLALKSGLLAIKEQLLSIGVAASVLQRVEEYIAPHHPRQPEARTDSTQKS